LHDNIILIGSAPCALLDLGAIPRVCSYDFMAIGMDAVHLYRWPILYVATNHPEDIPDIYKRRHAIGGNLDFQIIGPDPHEGVHIVEPYRPPSGSSAITGAFAAVTLGYKKIILCGCPLDGKSPEGNPYSNFRPGWLVNRGAFGNKVRSMSGWTQELFGMPTMEWLLNAKGE